ncbi:hypothetical protein FQR65_LT11170 [Abscondita terminalis]|nr:hypothetical protein FQR65_LT11170 [Abscondita terminalis]
MTRKPTKFLLFDKVKEENVLKAVKELQVKNSDVFLVGHPKSGTTWAQEMIWLIVNDLDYEGAAAFVDERIPVLEMSGFLDKDKEGVSNPECHWNSVEFVKNMKDPRCIKTHLTWEKFPEEVVEGTKTPKIIYIARNPKDICISGYHYYKDVLNCIDCSFKEYCDNFLKGSNDRISNYWESVLHFWNLRNRSNALFIKYEEMKQDLASVIRNVAGFLEKTITEAQISELVKWLDFETMRNNKAVNHDNIYKKSGFIRNGKVGEHKKMMSDEIMKKFDAWIEENLKDSDYKFFNPIAHTPMGKSTTWKTPQRKITIKEFIEEVRTNIDHTDPLIKVPAELVFLMKADVNNRNPRDREIQIGFPELFESELTSYETRGSFIQIEQTVAYKINVETRRTDKTVTGLLYNEGEGKEL